MIKREEVREKREVRLVIMVLVPQCGVLSSAQLMSDVTSDLGAGAGVGEGYSLADKAVCPSGNVS